jgi:hypothetical protein
MAGAGNLDAGFVLASLDGSTGMNFKQLGMQRPPIKLKHEFSHFWSNGEHSCDSFPVETYIP